MIIVQIFSRKNHLILFLFVSIVLTASSCTGDKTGKKVKKSSEKKQSLVVRDWNKYPAIVERNTQSEVIALGDVHGGYERLVDLLSVGGLISKDQRSQVGYSWSGGNKILVCTGDTIDKGDRSLDVIDLLMALQAQAPGAGGEVVVTLGNHEVEFLADPQNKKAGEFRAELQKRGITPEAISNGEQPYGEWMMNRPFAARINDWFFAHGGNTSGRTISELAKGFREAVDRGDWNSAFLIGDDSLLEAQKWWEGNGDSTALLDAYLGALGVRHIVFGHDPGAFHKKGVIEEGKDGRIFLIDVGMSPAIDYSKGALLIIQSVGRTTVARSLDAAGNKIELWPTGGQ